MYQTALDKACFQHDMTYGDLKKKKILIRYCMIKHLILLKMQEMMDIDGVLLQHFINLKLHKMKLVDVKSSINIGFNKENNN